MERVKGEVRSGALAVGIEVDERGRLCSVSLPKRLPAGMDTTALADVISQLERYELALNGTHFQIKVWKAMRKIPWGSALTYGELAVKAGSPKAVRAVGQACGRNPLPLVIPCHRVLAASGIGGFASGLDWKAKLLEFETEPRPSI